MIYQRSKRIVIQTRSKLLKLLFSSKSSSENSQPEVKGKNSDSQPLEAWGINVFELESMSQNNLQINWNHLESWGAYYGLGNKKSQENTELQNFLQNFNSEFVMKMNKNATNEISERSIRSQLNSRFGIKGKQTNSNWSSL